jgi:hypothetical protein
MECIRAGTTPYMTPEEFKAAATWISAQTSLTIFFSLVGAFLLLFADPPLKWLAGGSPYNGGRWHSAMGAGALVVGLLVVMFVPPLARFFDIAPLSPGLYLWVVGLTLLWVISQVTLWRSWFMERFLDIDTTTI